jgi:hypothetical protein
MCPYRKSWFIDNHGMMTDKLFDKILADIKKEDPDCEARICPYLMNEPFADTKIIERIQKIISKFPNAIVEVSTNAELIRNCIPDLVSTLLEAKEAKIVISHHGIDKETFESTMKLDYETCLQNIIWLIGEVDGRIPIAIQTMAYSKDREFIYYNDRKVKRYWHKIFKDNNLSWKNVWLSTLEFHNRAGNVDIENWNYDIVARDIDSDHPFTCNKFYHTLNVLWNGEVVLCCMDYMHETPFGDLNKQTINEIFNSIKWKKLYDMGTGKLISPDDFICKRCQTGG